VLGSPSYPVRPLTLLLLQSSLSSSKYHTLPSLTRYFDHTRHHPDVRSSPSVTTLPALVTFDLDNAPKQERKAPMTKKKKKEAAVAPTETAKESQDKDKEVVDGKKRRGQRQREEEGSGETVPSLIDLRHTVHSVFLLVPCPSLKEEMRLTGSYSREAPRCGWVVRRAG